VCFRRKFAEVIAFRLIVVTGCAGAVQTWLARYENCLHEPARADFVADAGDKQPNKPNFIPTFILTSEERGVLAVARGRVKTIIWAIKQSFGIKIRL
jgi:hypothetical protein